MDPDHPSPSPRQGDRSEALLQRVLNDHRFRFLLVGGFNTAFGFAMFVAADLTIGRLLNPVNSVVASLATLVTSHLVAAVVAFILYRRFVFRVTGNVVIDFIRFESVYLLPLAANAVVLPALVVWGANRIVAQAIILVVMTLVSYLGHRHFSFRRPVVAGADDGGDTARDAPESADRR